MFESIILLLLGMGAFVSALPSGGGDKDTESEDEVGPGVSEDVVGEEEGFDAILGFQELFATDESVFEESVASTAGADVSTEEVGAVGDFSEMSDDLELHSGNAADILEGGNGNDTLISTDAAWTLPTANEEIDFYVDDVSDTLIGGAGNDVFFAGPGDIVLTGDGADTVNAYVGNVSLADFDASEDIYHLYLPGGEVNGGDEQGSSYDLTGRVEVDSSNSDYVSILVDGVSVANIPQQVGIVVAIVNSFDEEEYEIVFGNGIELIEANVILTVFREISS